MMPRRAVQLCLFLAVSGGLMLCIQGHAAAYTCTVPAMGTPPCTGYFTGQNTNGGATAVVLPAPGLTQVGIITPGNPAADFKSIVQADLNSADQRTSIGAAFIIDNMLGHARFNGAGGRSAGVNYAKNNMAAWVALVDYYANAPNGANYGVDWFYNPPLAQFCGTGGNPKTFNSSYFPNINDDAFEDTDCPGDEADLPLVHFYWAGGEFNIGRTCGNLEFRDDKIPPPSSGNGPPTGQIISVACDANQRQQDVTVQFSDPNGPTTGHIVIPGGTPAGYGGYTSADIGSPGGVITISEPTDTDPYTSQQVQLWVHDNGTNNLVKVDTDSTDTPCISLSCGSIAFNPTTIDPATSFNATTTVLNNLGDPPLPPLNPADLHLKITDSTGNQVYFSTQAAGGSGNTSSATFTNIGPLGGNGSYNFVWNITVPSVGLNLSCNDNSVLIAAKPYLHVYGGDVSIGRSALYDPSKGINGQDCTGDDDQSGIYGWNNLAPDFSGAGAQYAVQSLDQIIGFASGVGTPAPPPTGLSFANYLPGTGYVDPANGLFGGFSKSDSWDCDFTSDIPNPAGVTVATDCIATDCLLSDSVVNGIVFVIVRNEDVYIRHNIVYGSTSWNSPNDIPYFRLVVENGNIFIDHDNVNQLDGVYVAERDTTHADDGTVGRIYTCATAAGRVDITQPGSYSTCNHKLIVNGAFISEGGEYTRTYGTVGQASGDTLASNHAAEVFNYTPELWLPRNGAVGGNGYDAITGLPPVL